MVLDDGIAWRKSSFSADGADGNCVEAGWRKSSRSGAVGNCVELNWLKASFSGAGNDCVEAAQCSCGASEERTLVRDTKNRAGGTLELDARAWTGLLAFARR